MIKRKRYYDGYGNEFAIDEESSGVLKLSITKTEKKFVKNEIQIPLNNLLEMISDTVPVKGKHVKIDINNVKNLEIR